MREEFEKLPEIAKLIEEGKGDNLVFVPETNKYDAEMYITFTPDYVHYLNGAWCAFQEQQKKIEAIKSIAEKWENTEYTYNSDSTDTKIEQMRACGREIIQELIK